MLSKHVGGPAGRAASVFKQGLHLVANNPALLSYFYISLVFTGPVYGAINYSIIHQWYNDIFVAVNSVAPHRLAGILGIVAFSTFYAALVSAYLTCAISASVLAQLENKPAPLLLGLKQVGDNFWRVTGFAFLAIFLFPMGVYAQRRKLPRGIVGVVGSSLTLHMAQMAPAILTTKKPMGATVRDSINTLGESWREGLILKVGMYVSIFLIVVLPKLIQHGLFRSHTASTVGWLVGLELAISGYVIFKIINAVFTSVLYYRIKNKKI